MQNIIVTADITLKPPKLEYAPTIFKLVEQNRTYLGQWLPWVEGTQAESDTEGFLEHVIRLNHEGRQLSTVIFYKNEIVGLIGLNTIDAINRKGNIGYWLSADKQGLGIITKSCAGLVQYAFENLQLNKLVLLAAFENRKSRAVPERLGFTQEGVLRDDVKLNGVFVDIVVYGLLKEEWEKT